MNMYNRVDRKGVRMLVSKNEEAAIVGLRDSGILNTTSLNATEAVKFAQSVLDASGAKVKVVSIPEEEVLIHDSGDLQCGSGSHRMRVSGGIKVSNLYGVMSNLAGIIAYLEEQEGAEARERKEREDLAELLDIDLSLDDVEGRKALDVLVKRRKGL